MVSNDEYPYAYIKLIISLVFQTGMIISGMAMLSGEYVSQEIQGSVAGAYSFCGAIGIIIVSKVGGVLFDQFKRGAPFLILGIGHLVCSLFAIVLLAIRYYKYIKNRSR